MNTVGPSDIRRANALACLAAMRSAGRPITITEIAQATQLSRPTVDAVLVDLEQKGVVAARTAEEPAAVGGRPARRYELNRTSALIAGIDAGPRNVRVLIADLTGEIVARAARSVEGEPDADERLSLVGDVVTEALAAGGLPVERLRAACVAASGIIGADGRVADSIAVPSWNGFPIAEGLARRFGMYAHLENDIKLAAFAEHHTGAARDVEDILFVQTGNRLAIACTFGGQIFQGAHRASGEVGSLRGMRWASNSVKGQLTWRSGTSAEGVFAAALAGDEDALAEVRDFIAEIAPLLTTVSLVLDPSRIVVGGGLSRAGGLFVDMLRDEVHRLIVLSEKPDVVASPLGSLGTAMGALAAAFQEWSEVLFGYAEVPVPTLSLSDDVKGMA